MALTLAPAAGATNINYCSGTWEDAYPYFCWSPYITTAQANAFGDYGAPNWFSYDQGNTYAHSDNACAALYNVGAACNNYGGWYPYSVWLCYSSEYYTYAGASIANFLDTIAGHGDNYYRNC